MTAATDSNHTDRHSRLCAVRSRLRDERGAALVEFALILPVALLVLLGIAQFALALNTANDSTNIANEVARFATVNQNPASGGESLAQWAKKQADSNFFANGGSVCISFPNGNAQIGDPVRVTVQSNMNWLPILKLKAASTTITGSATMRLEAAPTVYSAGCV